MAMLSLLTLLGEAGGRIQAKGEYKHFKSASMLEWNGKETEPSEIKFAFIRDAFASAHSL